ncbi:MAG TPA: acyl-CoA dehydrogenase family protein [Falsiroseomonas sp.]|jgi:alkylation response protein AidB-like acyl-CoA dehydrogenase|nr:acyl-CoA dehydrogenase family protein [Falsiroseomonas sp.]
MDFTIPEELRAVQETVRRFVQRELVPIEQDYPDGMPYDEELAWRKRARELGLFMMHVPESYGGSGINTLGMALVYQETAQTTLNADFFLGIDQPNPVALMSHGSEEVQRRYMMPAVRGERYWGFAMSEPGAGSDAQAITTSAVREGEDWVLSGTKLWISRMAVADFAVVLAVTDKAKRGRGGISIFLVDRDNPGMRVSRVIRTMGEELHDKRGPTELEFVDCRVPGWGLIGQVGEGFRLAQQRLGAQRITIAAQCLGGAQRALEMAIAYTQQRRTWGEPVANRQGIQWMFAQAAMDIHAARLMTYHCATRWDAGQDVRLEASMAKLAASEMVSRVVDMAMQVHGGMGYAKDLPLERIYRRARLQRIVEGASEIHRNVIGKLLVGGRRPVI